MADSKSLSRHTVIIDGRNSTKMTGVVDVISFDMETIVAETEMGIIVLKGQNLHVNRLDLQNGELDVDGEVLSVTYEDHFAGASGKHSFFGGLFK